MSEPFTLTAIPDLLPEGEFKGHLETVTFVAANENESHKWWAVNVGTFETDFRKIVSPELARHVVEKLKSGETVEFPNRYELEEVKGRFGGSWRTSVFVVAENPVSGQQGVSYSLRMLRFEFAARGVMIGSSDLEGRDPTMGVAGGRFEPSAAYATIQSVVRKSRKHSWG